MYKLRNRKYPFKLCAFCFLIALCYHIIIATTQPVATEEPIITVAATVSPYPAPSATPTATQTPAKNKKSYILNLNTKKFHYPNCHSVKQMAEKNKKHYTGTREEVISKGYSPCKNCDP